MWEHWCIDLSTPTPNPSPQGGGERTERAALLSASISTDARSCDERIVEPACAEQHVPRRRSAYAMKDDRKMFEVRNLSSAYGQSEVLHGIDLAVAPGEIVALVGRNGMGKSTLMKSLIGIMPVRSGQIVVDGADVTALAAHQRVARGLAYVPQGRQIFGTMTVKENIETGLVVTGRREIPRAIFDLFPILADFEQRRGGNLSGGQQQQLAFARALASDPKVLLLDEPTEGIQPSIIKDMARLLRDIRSVRNLCIVVCEQVLSFVLDIADRILVMEGGRIVHTDTREHVDEAAISRFLAV
jgi:urea transport system ATP-binding protein